jgi:hypothetical protein
VQQFSRECSHFDEEILFYFTDEFDASVASLQSAAESLNADCVLLRERIVTADEASGQQQQPASNDHSDEKVAKKTGQYLVRQRADEKVGFRYRTLCS